MTASTTPSPTAPNEALRLIERAEKAVDDLCAGRLRWEMRVPAEPDHDPDLIISAALRAARAALRTERLRVVEQIREAVYSSHPKGRCLLGVDSIEPILDAVAGLSGEEPT